MLFGNVVNESCVSSIQGSWAVSTLLPVPRQHPLRAHPMATDLDFEQEVKADPKDPRSEPSWPCFSQHQPSKMQSNKWAAWCHCQVCGLRLAPANQTSNPNPAMVKRVLMELEKTLDDDIKPTEELFRIYMEKIIEEDRIQILLKDLEKGKQKALQAFC